jgi:hypothetical protein
MIFVEGQTGLTMDNSAFANEGAVVHSQAGLPLDEDHIAGAYRFARAVINVWEYIAALAGFGENSLVWHAALLIAFS